MLWYNKDFCKIYDFFFEKFLIDFLFERKLRNILLVKKWERGGEEKKITF